MNKHWTHPNTNYINTYLPNYHTYIHTSIKHTNLRRNYWQIYLIHRSRLSEWWCHQLSIHVRWRVVWPQPMYSLKPIPMGHIHGTNRWHHLGKRPQPISCPIPIPMGHIHGTNRWHHQSKRSQPISCPIPIPMGHTYAKNHLGERPQAVYGVSTCSADPYSGQSQFDVWTVSKVLVHPSPSATTTSSSSSSSSWRE